MRGSTAGLAEGTIVTPDTVHAAFLVFLDVMFSSVIAAPVVVAYWRGSWNLMNIALFPVEPHEKPIMSAITSMLIGTIGHFVFYYYQGKFSKTFHPDKHRITYMIFSRIYTAIYGIVCVNGWRGGWTLMDIYITNKTVPMYFSILMISCVLLAFCKCLRNITASPFAISTDHSKDYFAVPTMFKSSASSDPGFYFIDCAFSVLIIGTLVIFVWRCMFALCDLLIYPTDINLSAWYSLAVGYGIIAVTFALQPLMKWACGRLKGVWRIAVADVFLFLSFVGTANVWRGLWAILDHHFLPNEPVISNSITHGVSITILAMLNCSNSVLVRGVYIDGAEPGGQCVVFPVYYIRLFFQKERTKKQLRRLHDAEKGEQQTELLEKSEKLEKGSPQPVVKTNVNGERKIGTT